MYSKVEIFIEWYLENELQILLHLIKEDIVFILDLYGLHARIPL